jgi:hypothetical protein
VAETKELQQHSTLTFLARDLLALRGTPVLVPTQAALSVVLPTSTAAAGGRAVDHRAFPALVTIQGTRGARPVCLHARD